MIHLYYGEGKGKTTAACGLAVRAAGSGMRVLFTQFFKDGSSSEVGVLASLPNVTVKLPPVYFGRFKMMTEAQKLETGSCYTGFLKSIVELAADHDLIVLDEIVSAYGYGMVDGEELIGFLRREGNKREIVLTGRGPARELIELADYATEMRKEKHPYDRGEPARKGIEF